MKLKDDVMNLDETSVNSGDEVEHRFDEHEDEHRFDEREDELRWRSWTQLWTPDDMKLHNVRDNVDGILFKNCSRWN